MAQAALHIDWRAYPRTAALDELVGPGGRARPPAGALLEFLNRLDGAELFNRRKAAEHAVRALGITFTVYSDGANIDRQWPFDIIPRILRASEWRRVEAGLAQRLRALNCFIDDVYHRQQ
jgi:uncharacterized circularly permuted ATP-grasp superfamily protein